MTRYYGKYAGTVQNNIDPMALGRLQVEVAILNTALAWAWPCVPYAGPGVGFLFLPPIGANVWVEFEAGDPDHPIWSGCFWTSLGPPPLPALPTSKVLKTEAFTLTILEPPGVPNAAVITLETAAGMKITLDPAKVEITNGMGATISLTGPSVALNNDALQVT